MRAFLEVINGRYAGTTAAVETGEVCDVGSRLGADVFLPNDSRLAPIHFAVLGEDNGFCIQTAARGVFLNNEPIEKSALAHNDFICAGKTVFYFALAGETTAPETPLGKLIERLTRIPTLCALVDENLDSRIQPLLESSNAGFRVIKQNAKQLEGLTANPLLIKIFGNQPLLENLVRSFWGKGWLVFVEPRGGTLNEALRHFRRLLEQTLIEYNSDLRFYDPRVLRTILAAAEQRHAKHFFGGAERFLLESQLPAHLLEFGWTNDKTTAKSTRLSAADNY